MRILVDTGALVALVRSKDQYHTKAVALDRHLSAQGARFVGTTLILGEMYSQLVYSGGAAFARAVLSRLLDNPFCVWLEVDDELVRDALANWLARYSDQKFSLVDAVSFEVMRREKIKQAFAFDRHFEVAGYELLH